MDRVYVVGVGEECDPIKIGFSTNLDKRLATLRSGLKFDLHLMASIPGGRVLEKELHLLFKKQAIGGEWFFRSPEIDAAIARLMGGCNHVELWPTWTGRYAAWVRQIHRALPARVNPYAHLEELTGIDFMSLVLFGVEGRRLPDTHEAATIEWSSRGLVPASLAFADSTIS